MIYFDTTKESGETPTSAFIDAILDLAWRDCWFWQAYRPPCMRISPYTAPGMHPPSWICINSVQRCGIPFTLSAVIAIHDITIVIWLSKYFLIWKFWNVQGRGVWFWIILLCLAVECSFSLCTPAWNNFWVIIIYSLYLMLAVFAYMVRWLLWNSPVHE